MKKQKFSINEKPVLFIDRSQFLDWFFDYDVKKDFFNDYSILSNLKNYGKFEITEQEILDGCEYIPVNLVHKSCRNIIALDEAGEINYNFYSKIEFFK